MAVILGIVSTAGAQPSAPGPERDLGAETRGIFAAKCAACHGSDLAKPKGRFGYVLDLRKVAGNPEMVIPSQPDESELWILVSRGEMPPPDSPHGPLSEAEKEIIRSWIAAGAPDAMPPLPGNPNAIAAIEPPPTTFASMTAPERMLRWLGKFHLLMIHFPIALMLAAGVGEVRSIWRGSRTPSQVVPFCLALAAVAAIPTVIFGWLHAAAGNGVGSPPLLFAHRWMGTVAGTWIIGTALCAWRDAQVGLRSRVVRVGLAIGITLIIMTAHLGGLMSRGSDFFDW